MSDNNNIEVIMGDDSNLNISEVGDCMNNLRPKNVDKKKNVVIPVVKSKKENEKNDENG